MLPESETEGNPILVDRSEFENEEGMKERLLGCILNIQLKMYFMWRISWERSLLFFNICENLAKQI